MVDHGSLKPLDLYNKNDAYDLTAVRESILSKKLAPFYKGTLLQKKKRLFC